MQKLSHRSNGDYPKKTALSRDFFLRDSHAAARGLLGKFLATREHAAMITEVEVYDGFSDLASHASRGKTKRNAVMFDAGGRWYVYFCYGMHWMLNVTTREAGYPAAILLRGVEGVRGPGRLTKHFGVDKRFHETTVAQKSGLWIEDRGVSIEPHRIQQAPRIGVDYAGKKWAGKRWRYMLDG